MAIEIKEYVGFSSSEPTKNNEIIVRESATAVAVPQQMISPDSLMVDIEGIHSDVLTINCTKYSEQCLKNSLPHWTIPYEIPVIMHHNDEDGKIIGRVKNVEMIDSKRSGTPAILFTCNIGDEDGVKGIKNGTLSTVSIGAVAYDVTCSICGANVAECDCGHKKGRVYDGKLCYWTINDMEPREVSYVILPSDKYAQTMKVYKPGKKELKESVEVKKMSVCDEIMKRLTESVIEDDEPDKDKKDEIKIDEEIKDEDKKPKDDKKSVVDEEKPADEEKADDNEEKEELEEKDPVIDEEKKDEEIEEDDNKDEEDSNKDDRDAIIDDLKKEVAGLKEELEKVKKQLKEEKKLKEKVELELAGFKVQEKISIARDIKVLKESIGIECKEAEEIAEENSIEELNLIYKTLKETCSCTKLPGKLVMESIVDEQSDNVAQGKKITESVGTEEEGYQDFLDLQNLHKRLFK